MAYSLTEAERDEVHTLVKEQFLDSQTGCHDELVESELARDYLDGKQWTADEEKELRKRGQAAIVDNLIADKVDFMLGMERKTRTDPQANPRNQSTDEQQAHAATDALRYVCDDNAFNKVRSNYIEEMLVEGIGAVHVWVDPRHAGPVPKIVIEDIERSRVYVDPLSRRKDYSDKRYCGIVVWMDLDDAKEMWPEKTGELDASCDAKTISDRDFYQDRPYFFYETKGRRRKRVQVMQHFYIRKGQWWTCKFVAGGFLEEPQVSPYIDADTQQPECELELQAYKRERKSGRAYGIVRRLKDLQDEWNKRGSKALHLLNSNRIILERGAAGSTPEEVEAVRAEMAKPDGVVELVQGLKFETQDGIQLSQAHVNLMLIRGRSLAQAGPNAALSGVSGDLSGRAKEIDQQGGLITIDYPFDQGRELTHRVYRQVWNRIKQFWTEETWIRIRDEEHVKFTALNKKVTRGEVVAAHLGTLTDMSDEEKAQILQMIAADPKYQQELVVNPVADIDIDITIDEVPDVVNLQAEQFNRLADLAKSKAIAIPPKALIKASQLRNKREIIAEMDGSQDPMQQRMAMLQVKAQELGLMQLEAEIRELMSRVQKNDAASAESKVDASVKIAEFLAPQAKPGSAEKRVLVS